MAATTTHKLNTGASIPAVGFGTWQDKDAQEDAVLTALRAGYRHIDTVSFEVQSMIDECVLLGDVMGTDCVMKGEDLWDRAGGGRGD